jgi:hypothetical protein
VHATGRRLLVGHFAGEARVTDAADMRKVLNTDKRLMLLISLVHERRTAAVDEVVTMFGKRMAALHGKAGSVWRRSRRPTARRSSG